MCAIRGEVCSLNSFDIGFHSINTSRACMNAVRIFQTAKPDEKWEEETRDGLSGNLITA